MTKIKNKVSYVVKTPLSLTDYAVGTNSEDLGVGMAKGQTISMQMVDIRNVVIAGLSPEIGGTLKITELEYTGVLTSPASVANALDPVYIVSAYEVLIFNINGNKYLLKLQDVTIGDGEPDISDSDFITIVAIKNLGDGTAVMTGYNADGEIEFRSLKSTGNDISVVSGNIVIDPKAGTSVGDAGVDVYKGLNATTKIHEIRKAKSTGFDVTIDGDSVRYETKAGGNLGTTGFQIYKGINATTKIHEFNTIDTEDFEIKETAGVLSINFVKTNDAPKFYVNSGYDIGGTAPETGSLAKPFKTLAPALVKYIGSGTAEAPQNFGAEIVVQKGIGYTFTGNLNVAGLTIRFEQGTSFVSNPSSGDWLCDFDSLSDSSFTLRVILEENAVLTLNKSGFRNKGTSASGSLFTTVKKIYLTGLGVIYSDYNSTGSSPYTILESNFTATDTFKNDGDVVFDCKDVILTSLTQRVYKIGGNSIFTFDNCTLQSGTLISSNNISLKAFEQIGGDVRLFSCSVFAGGSSIRTSLFTLNKSSGIPCSLTLKDPLISGTMTNLFINESSLQSTLKSTSLKTVFFSAVYIAKSPSVLWTSAEIYDSVTDYGEIDYSEVDLTGGNLRSTYNIFANNVVNNLRIFASRALAVAGGLEKGSVFVNRKEVSTGSFVAGVEYSIKTVGNTNFVAIGAASNTVGVYFTASGVGGGTTGVAYSSSIDILI